MRLAMEVLLEIAPVSCTAAPQVAQRAARSLLNSAWIDFRAPVTKRWNKLAQEGPDDLDLLCQRDDVQGRQVQEQPARVSPQGLREDRVISALTDEAAGVFGVLDLAPRDAAQDLDRELHVDTRRPIPRREGSELARDDAIVVLL